MGISLSKIFCLNKNYLYSILVSVFFFCSNSFAEDTFSNPVIDSSLSTPDVCVWKNDSAYYLLYTGGTRHVRIYKSKNLTDWQITGISPFSQQTIKDIEDMLIREKHPNDGMIWAPSVAKVGSKWNLYVALSNKGGIIALQSDSPTGPFQFVGLPKSLVTHETMNWEYDAIDPYVIQDDDGIYWLFFGSTFGIYAHQLTDDGLELAPNQSFIHIAGPKDPKTLVNGEKHGGYEGVFIYKHEGFWYCFVSKRNAYSIYVGKSKNITGPYIDADGKLLTEGFGTRMNHPTPGFEDPGHNGEIFKDKTGHYYMFYHARTKYIPKIFYGIRQTMLSEFIWENGFPHFIDYKSKEKGNRRPNL